MTQKFRPRVEGDGGRYYGSKFSCECWAYMWLVRDEIIDSLRMFVLVRGC